MRSVHERDIDSSPQVPWSVGLWFTGSFMLRALVKPCVRRALSGGGAIA